MIIYHRERGRISRDTLRLERVGRLTESQNALPGAGRDRCNCNPPRHATHLKTVNGDNLTTQHTRSPRNSTTRRWRRTAQGH
jgi:hypothetical protein